MTKSVFGMWIWGGITVGLAFAALGVVISAGFFIVPNGDSYHFAGAPQNLIGLFYALKENDNLVAGVLGFSGLAWAHFFKVVHGAG